MKVASFCLFISSAACAAGLKYNPPPPNPALNMHFGKMKIDPLSCGNLAMEKYAITAYLKDGSRLEGSSDLCRDSEEEEEEARLKLNDRTILLPALALGMEEVKDESGSVKDIRFQGGPLFLVSVGLMVGSWVPWLATAENHHKALDAYNRNPP